MDWITQQVDCLVFVAGLAYMVAAAVNVVLAQNGQIVWMVMQVSRGTERWVQADLDVPAIVDSVHPLRIELSKAGTP